jgi:hypothetical protein
MLPPPRFLLFRVFFIPTKMLLMSQNAILYSDTRHTSRHLRVALRSCFAWQTRKACGYGEGIVSSLRMFEMINSSEINSKPDASLFSLFAILVFYTCIPVRNITEY